MNDKGGLVLTFLLLGGHNNPLVSHALPQINTAWTLASWINTQHNNGKRFFITWWGLPWRKSQAVGYWIFWNEVNWCRPGKTVKWVMHGKRWLTRFLVNSNNESSLQITNKGFQFLLQDVNTQVWAFLLQYLDMAEVSTIAGKTVR